jgi:hypothetical protein
MLNEMVESQVAATGEPARVEGRIFFDHGLPAIDLPIRLYHREFGCTEIKLGETTTDERGFYALSYEPTQTALSLEVRAADASGKEVSLSATRYHAQSREIFNLIAPTSLRPLHPEYLRLKTDLTEHLGEQRKLAEARENFACQDITLLQRATNWDARLIALLALAAKLSEESGISEVALYGLFRVGLPTDKRLLAHVSLTAVVEALKKAVKAEIIFLSSKQITTAKTAFQKFARKHRRTAKATGAPSSFADLLRRAGLTQPEEVMFENLYFEHRGTPAELWQKAAQKGISKAKLAMLQRQGKLAYLTLNNADLAEAIQKEVGATDDLGVLVDKDLYQTEAWKNRLLAMAGKSDAALRKLIPPAYKGEKTADRLQAYCADLARKVRRSHPTRVIARMVEKDDLHLGKHHEKLKQPVNTFLKNAEDLGFSLGRAPINQFIVQNHEDVFKGVDDADVEATTRTVQKLHRLYQITPTDEALQLVLNAGFDSAYDVAGQPYETFLKSYGDQFATDADVSLSVASLVYRKAQQVASVSYNFFASAKQLDSAPTVYAISPSAQAQQEAKNELIKHYPTMESLFGSLDFCECEHCRSVLSPAAYLVDLFQFLNPDDPAWNSFLTYWETTHNGQAYTAQHLKAYDALVERRPDLPHLPLTCENTNTVMPYIDIVNEILEYYVAQGSLDPEAVRDTGEATTAELLAEPQNILQGAYVQLKESQYPIGLPFDLWLETVRQFCEQFGVSLWQVLEVFGNTEELFSQPGSQAPYDLSAIYTEYLGLSPDEYALLTNTNPLASWHKLYGFDDPAKTAAQNKQAALAALASAKTLARCLGVSYKQVIEIVRTGFVNPQLDALVILQKLGVEIGDLLRYKNNENLLLNPPANPSSEELSLIQELQEFKQRLEGLAETYTGFNAVAWLNQAWQDKVFDAVLVLADPDAGCNFDATTLRYADGTSVDALALIKINLFVRLWKKLGWTIEETDRALRAFLPANSLPLAANGLGEALQTALIYLAHFKWLDGAIKVGRNRRIKLLTLWTALPTTGSKPLYAQLFLTRSVLKQDEVFDNPLGNYLAQSGVLIKDHLLALQAALSLTANDIASILVDSGLAMDTAGLTLANVSLLYRYGLLAKALKLSVHELISLKSLAGLDPFKPLSPDPLTTLAEDYPFTQTMRFVKVAARVKESGLRIEDLDYLFRQRFDPVGKYRPNPDALLSLVKSLAADLSRIRDEQAVTASLTDDLLRQKLALVLTPEALVAFVAAITGAAEAEATQDSVQPADKLNPKAFAGDPSIRLDYSEVQLRQRLINRGLLLDARKQQLESANPSPLLASLLDQAQTLGFASFAEQITAVLTSLIDTTEYHAIRENVLPADKLDPLAFAAEPAIRVAYDEARAIQRLTWRGLLPNARKQSLNATINSPVLADLLDAIHNQSLADASSLINGSLANLVASLEFTATQDNVQLSDRLDPNSFDPRVRVAYEDALAWDAAKTYQTDDAVSFNGSIWIAQQTNTGVQPVSGTDWAGPQGRTQSLALQGLLSDAKRAQLESANPSTVLANLLDAIQSQSDAFIQQLRVGLLVTSDFDSLFTQLAALSDTDEDPRARLVKALTPFIIRKLTRQLAVQTVAAGLGADRDLTEALMTDGALLVDPTEPDSTLVEAFTAANDQGISAAFFASSDASGAPLEMRRVATADTLDKPSGVNSVRFEGYLQVPSAGPYRFFALSALQNSQIELRFGDLPEPLLQGKAATDDAEISAFVDLKPGITYRFSFTASNLSGGSANDGNAALLVQGENLPKGSLARLTLFPAESVERLRRANLLLAKSLQLIEGLGLTQREVRHLLTHAADFDGISLNKLPTREADESPVQATALFGSFLRLVEYTRLKGEAAGETDDLIGIFENARHTFPAQADADLAKAALLDDLCKRFADLCRRDVAVVRQMAKRLGFDDGAQFDAVAQRAASAEFAQEQGLRRLWDALQVLEIFGVAGDALINATEIISTTKTSDERFAIAGALRNTVKARYEPENWQRVAQPIFDKLRQRQRDALVAHIMHRDGFERVEELFEYFLIDPGMEPVVQTSRLRLAISSVQLFIQRCLLNLELKVDPSAINAKHWEWMKRYRVWEANRKIFLFPENWLEPEFRDDKTHLFQELESTLLAGDISSDLADDAFFTYLKKLEELARLDIVAMECEEKPLDPASNTIHVIGRTFSQPHQYFYRRYQYRMWTPWEPVPVEIDGDHVVAVVWRQRLHLFWVTFLEKAKQDTSGQTITVDFKKSIAVPTGPARQIDVQLNWSEYFQGQWATREAGGFSKPITVDVASNFDRREVFIYAAKEQGDSGEESAVRIQLNGEMNLNGNGGPGQFIGGKKWQTAFRVVSKHSPPEAVVRDPFEPFELPYSKDHAEVNRYTGSGELDVTFVEKVEDAGGQYPSWTVATKKILRKVDNYSLLVPNILPQLVAPQFGPLITPFFFADRQHTFYVEPTLTEQTYTEWEDWIIPLPYPDLDIDLPVTANVPEWLDPGGPVEIDPLARFGIQEVGDWLATPQVVLRYDEAWVGIRGGVDVEMLPAMQMSNLDTLANLGGRLTGAMINGGGMTSVGLQGLTLGSQKGASPMIGGNLTGTIIGG